MSFVKKSWIALPLLTLLASCGGESGAGDGSASDEALRNEMLIGQLQGGAVNRRIEISRQEIENYLRSEAGQTQIAPEYRIAHVLIPNSPGVSAAQQEELATLLHERITESLAAAAQVAGGPVSPEVRRAGQ